MESVIGVGGHPVKIGAPHFVDFGKDMEHSPDCKAYLLAQGAELTDPKPRIANLSWITATRSTCCGLSRGSIISTMPRSTSSSQVGIPPASRSGPRSYAPLFPGISMI